MTLASESTRQVGPPTDAGHDRLQFGIKRPGGPPPFYSELLRRAQAAPMSAAPPAAWLGWLRGLPKAGVSLDEIEWSAVRDWLEMQDGKIRKEAVVSYLTDAVPEIGTVLLSMAEADEADPSFDGLPRYYVWGPGDGWNHRELLLVVGNGDRPPNVPMHRVTTGYKSGHWPDMRNILAHVRTDERKDDDGHRILFVYEIQGDWPQDWRRAHKAVERAVSEGFDGIVKRMQRAGVLEHGADGRYSYRGRTYDAQAFRNLLSSLSPAEAAPFMSRVEDVPDAPFIDSTEKWVALVLKHVIRLAVDKGIDRIAFIGGQWLCEVTELTGKAADGSRAFYDRVVPAVAKEVLRKLGGAPCVPRIDGRKFIGFDITPALRARVRDGLPLF